MQPGAVHAVLGDDEGVGELRPDDDDGVEAVAAVDVDRRVHHVLDEVRAFLTFNLGLPTGVLLRADQCEGLDEEGIVAPAALQAQHGLVVEDHETVLPFAAVRGRGEGDAVAQVAYGRLDRGVHVPVGDVRIGRSRRPVELAELEGVVAVTAMEGGGRGVVVAREGVVATQAVDDQAFVHALVVVDALHLGGDAVQTVVERAVHQRHKAARPVAIRGHAAEQEQVVILGAVDREQILAIGRRAGIDGIDDVVAHVARAASQASGRVHPVLVGAALSVQVERITLSSGRGGHRLEEVDDQLVGAVAGEHVGLAEQLGAIEEDVIAISIALDVDGLTFDHAAEADLRAIDVQVPVVALDGDARVGGDPARARRLDIVAGQQRHR